MLSFAVYKNGQRAERLNLSGAYLIGTDDVPLRAELTFKSGVLHCRKRSAGPAGLVLLWQMDGGGEILTETVRLMEREQPYILSIELARGRLMRISQKIEDWGLIDYEGAEPLVERIREAKELLIKALTAESPEKGSVFGDQALAASVKVSEELSQFHAGVFLGRRKQSGGFTRRVFGCGVATDESTELVGTRLANAFDFVTLPFVWREIEPTEQTFNYKPLDGWVQALSKQRVPIKGAGLLCFDETHVPDWLFIWEHDFDTIRDLAFEHVRRVLNRYGQQVQVWDVISGIHATNCFAFNFEQLMELTRMAAALTKQMLPRGTAIIEIVAPWGEYYARNQRTIPPLLYADMTVQSGVNFDAFGLRFQFGKPEDGSYMRDLFQVSSLIDSFAKLGKPLHISAVQVPSEVPADGQKSAARGNAQAGSWRGAWSEDLQAEWLVHFLEIVLSKPFVETVTWHGLTDHQRHGVPNGGLLSSGMAPKAAYNRLQEMRSGIRSAGAPAN